MITTKSNKVYIGYINKLSEPLGDVFINIIPNFSGFRDKDNLKVKITTSYTKFIENYLISDNPEKIDQKLGIVLPVSEILFVSKFDTEIFSKFNELEDSTQDSPLAS